MVTGRTCATVEEIMASRIYTKQEIAAAMLQYINSTGEVDGIEYDSYIGQGIHKLYIHIDDLEKTAGENDGV